MVMEDGVRRELLAVAVNAEVLHLPASYLSFYCMQQCCNKIFIIIKHCNSSLSKLGTLVLSLSLSLSTVHDTVLLFLICVDFPPINLHCSS